MWHSAGIQTMDLITTVLPPLLPAVCSHCSDRCLYNRSIVKVRLGRIHQMLTSLPKLQYHSACVEQHLRPSSNALSGASQYCHMLQTPLKLSMLLTSFHQPYTFQSHPAPLLSYKSPLTPPPSQEYAMSAGALYGLKVSSAVGRLPCVKFCPATGQLTRHVRCRFR